MPDITKREKIIRENVINECWQYIQDNFHKFNESNKLKVALAISLKSIPQEVEGISQQIVVMNEIKKGETPLRFELGSPANASEVT